MEKKTKNLGGIGYILLLAGMVLGFALPGINLLLTIGGFVMILIAYLNLSGEFNEPDLKSLVIKSVLFGVAAAVLMLVAFGAGFAAAFKATEAAESAMPKFSAGLIVVGLIAYGLTVYASYLWYKANVLVAEHTNVNLFKTGGLLQFIGTAAAIIIVGGIVSLVGFVLLTVAFFSTQEVETAQPAPPVA